jgi:hypothetical protein
MRPDGNFRAYMPGGHFRRLAHLIPTLDDCDEAAMIATARNLCADFVIPVQQRIIVQRQWCQNGVKDSRGRSGSYYLRREFGVSTRFFRRRTR